MKKIYKFLIVALASTTLYSCDEDLLNVPNENTPDFAKVYANGADVENVASGLYNAVFRGEHMASGVEPMLGVAADHATCSWGNFGMRDMSWEPRDMGWNNSPTYSNATYTKYSFDRWYSAIASASNVIRAIESGVQIGENGVDNNRSLAFAKFVQGIAYGNLALIFDRSHVVDEKTSAEPTLEATLPYKEVAAKAIAYLEEAKTLAGSSFTIPSTWMGSEADLSNADFLKIINTSAARILAYAPRNKSENAQVDWDKVRSYADAGITSDWNVVMDNAVKWYFEAGDYLTFPGWGRVDMYVAHLMDPKLPQHWDDRPDFPYPAKSTSPIDQRLLTDFEYLSSNDFQAARGYYHFSAYRFTRFDAEYVNAVGPKPTVSLAENDMLRAEARAHKGDLEGAAAIINAGTRITRGKMTPVAANLEEILKAIHHERHVEMYTTGMALQFYEMRKNDLLQKGTPLHLPIPAGILQTMGITDFYTFGTVAKADGINTSNGGWR